MFRIDRTGPYKIANDDDGFSVEHAGGVHYLIYRERERSVTITVEPLDGKPFWFVLYRHSIKAWNPPHESDHLSKQDVDRIIANVRRCYDFVETPFELDEGPFGGYGPLDSSDCQAVDDAKPREWNGYGFLDSPTGQ